MVINEIMNFYIDESGHTGLNLFDNSQPVLYYGVLSSPFDLNITARPLVERLRAHFDVNRLHASELGGRKILSILHELENLRKEYQISIDIFSVVKKDYAAISFFDQVFDQGLNKSVPWEAYWTPQRYFILGHTARLWDDKSLERSWKARCEKNKKKSNEMLKSVLQILLPRASNIKHVEASNIITNAFRWAIKHPDAISYNSLDKKYDLQISPNLIGFQSVLHGISARLKDSNKKAASVIVDRQNQFNDAQDILVKTYQCLKGSLYEEIDTGLPVMDLQYLPEISISCVAGTENIGLELVDIYLWIYKRILEGKISDTRLDDLIQELNESKYNNTVSIIAILDQWKDYF